MSSLLVPLLLLALSQTAIVTANNPIPDALFTSSPGLVIAAAAPLWHLDAKTCFPSAAVQADGSQTPSVREDTCGIFNGGLAAGCPVQAPQTQAAQLATSFPTYYTLRKCERDASWRIVYDVFFQKDTGHPYDWEWAAVKFLPNAQGDYVRDGVFLEQDGNHPYVRWADIPHTFDNENDKFQNNNAGRDHAKLYFGKWKHHVDVVFGDKFANDCLGAVANKDDYHSDDYQFFAADNLVAGTVVPASYIYGKADSTPQSFEAGGKYDICDPRFP